MRRLKHPALTLTDVVVTLFVVLFLLAAILPAAGVADNENTRWLCTKNLKAIGQAMLAYSNDNNGKFPRTYYDPQRLDKMVAYSHPKGADPFGKDGVEPNDVTAGMYLLIRTEKVDPKLFICPGTDAKPLRFGKGAGAIAEKATDLCNFPSAANLSYSGDCPFPSMSALLTMWVWDFAAVDDFPLISDMNPGTEAVTKITPKLTPAELSKANSLNHGGKGQNVLYVDGHVAFKTTPFCGPKQADGTIDNIFTRHMIDASDSAHPKKLQGEQVFAPPTDGADAVMLPTANYKTPGAKAK